MRFRDLSGQEALTSKLVQELQSGRTAHAYLFHGPPGSGQLPLAWAFASYIFCEDPGTDSCGSCDRCQRMAKLAHPDLHFSFPFIKRSGKQENSEPLQSLFRETLCKDPFISLEKWLRETGEENKQGVIPVAESERIVESLNLKAYEGDKKLMLIWMAEKLNPEAANKLLKILEEPPPDTIFILLSEDPSAILPTIRSRTRISPLAPLSDEAVKENLLHFAGLGEEEVEKIAGPADGDMGLAMELAIQADSGEYFQEFTRWMRICFKGTIPDGMEWVESVASKGREWHKNLLVYGLHILRQCMLHNHVDRSKVRASEEERKFEEKFRHYVPATQLPTLTGIFEEACADIERNGNPRILFFDTTLQVIRSFSQVQGGRS
ncbi:MAG: ATP-binding protein [Flavobacteriales bacterium]